MLHWQHKYCTGKSGQEKDGASADVKINEVVYIIFTNFSENKEE